ncbi:DUF6615 family protein [Leisingera sp. ANG-S5]|uniref:DUF6615 family protein n=1 Tax=Leisingera sp. ANG-S5 TaxID=1577901 RepID=UPI001269FFE2|nr:DUF6615 family protein [Leisingera sp. ANG-S5]
MFEACALAISLEEFSKTFFQLETKSQKWKVLETSFTDVIIAAFKHHNLISVFSDGSVEALTGADIEILVIPQHGIPVVFVIQAKRSERSSSTSENYSFKHIFHRATKSSPFQVEQLEDYCNKQNNGSFPAGLLLGAVHIPLYAFYHSSDAADSLGCSGIMLNGIQTVKSQVEAKPPKKQKVRLCATHQVGAFPFHKIFCPSPTFYTQQTLAKRFSISEFPEMPKEGIEPDFEEWETTPSFSSRRERAREFAFSWLHFEERGQSGSASHMRATFIQERFATT